jgi:hypothetical protein
VRPLELGRACIYRLPTAPKQQLHTSHHSIRPNSVCFTAFIPHSDDMTSCCRGCMICDLWMCGYRVPRCASLVRPKKARRRPRSSITFRLQVTPTLVKQTSFETSVRFVYHTAHRWFVIPAPWARYATYVDAGRPFAP